MTRFNFKAIGTSWKIDIHDALHLAQEKSLLTQVMARIDAFDKAYSRFRADSLVTQMSKKAGTYELPDDAEAMMSIYRDLYERTDGRVTPLVGSLISDAGYDAEYSLVQKKELESPPLWDEAIEYHHPMLKIKKQVLLDFGAAGKGYLVDLVGQVLESENIRGYGIDAGGDILYRGKHPIKVGLEDPHQKGKVIGFCSLKEGSICGSAGNRRAWGRFTHIMDPKTLSSPTGIAAVWVVADRALVADALTTCLFFVSPDVLKKAYGFEYIVMHKDRSVDVSPGFPGELFKGAGPPGTE